MKKETHCDISHQAPTPTPTPTSQQRYRPLFVIIMIVAVAALTLSLSSEQPHAFMRYFMGLFLVQFSLFKFFDLRGFIEDFGLYDLMAKRWPVYGWCYPFIELGLGVLYLSGFWQSPVNLVTVVVMSISGAGVLIALARGNEDLRCACLGTGLNLPLGAVSVLENGSMAAMALWMLAL